MLLHSVQTLKCPAVIRSHDLGVVSSLLITYRRYVNIKLQKLIYLSLSYEHYDQDLRLF